MRSVIAAEQAAEKAALKEKHQKQREQHRQQFRPYPDLEQWQRMQKSPSLPSSGGTAPASRSASRARAASRRRRETSAPISLKSWASRCITAGRKKRGRRGVSFVDKGKSIDIHDWRNRDSTLAALQLSAQKWGSFTVTGTTNTRPCARS
uniref:LPD7 domain-containing protein n=1 Tax=Klebsiella pneumoniae TaxID=573 RepID=UPI003A5CB888